MRSIKMLGLAMVAAVVAMAFLGAGTASATLCKVKESPCSAGNQYPAHTTVLALSKATKLIATFGSALCHSHVTLLHEGVKSGKLFGKITALTWTNCTGCNPVTTTTNGTFEDEPTSGGNGTLFPKGTVVLLKNCAFGAECTASATAGTTKLALTGGTIGGTAQATAKTSVGLSGFGCGSSGTWETEEPYVVTSVNGSAAGSIFLE